MPWRTIRPYPSHFTDCRRAPREAAWPTRRIWFTSLQAADIVEGEQMRFGIWHRLRTTRLWQTAPLSTELRDWAADPRSRFEAWEMAENRQDPAFALVYRFWADLAHYQHMPVTTDGVAMEYDTHTIGIMANRVFTVRREFHAFSAAVDYLEGRDPETQRSLSVLPVKDPVDDDVAADDLAGLG
ncbi:hypothetical protein G3T14_10655 [Methylobacterium sp. BTF04]|uniref:hypothetical protein n=1 Tax=Methylobacterium sp. BTF04 TaxID=2708300 RepID=UPI0013D6D02E|nr:hypothetical protein [Methylobacterium sp. BTF04]NEU12597.1 hypothetical protein [Methylobacterium sp. BTF04]